MSTHNITPRFGSFNEEPKAPWYKKPVTYFIGVPVLLVIIIVNGIVGDNGKPTGAEPAPAPVVTEEPEVVEPIKEEPALEPIQVEPVPSTQELALIVLRDGWPYFATVPDAAIDEAALAACDGFDAGMAWETYILVAAGSDIPAEEAGALAGYAINVYCPQHSTIADGY